MSIKFHFIFTIYYVAVGILNQPHCVVCMSSCVPNMDIGHYDHLWELCYFLKTVQLTVY